MRCGRPVKRVSASSDRGRGRSERLGRGARPRARSRGCALPAAPAGRRERRRAASPPTSETSTPASTQTADSCGPRAGRPRRENRTRLAGVASPRANGVVGVEDGGVFAGLAREEPRLGLGVVREARVAVEMVGRDVRQHGDVRRGSGRSPRAGTRRPRRRSRGLRSPRKPESGSPMFPASATGRAAVPARLSISAIQVVVVDFPLVPVTATQRFAPGASASAMRYAISISARTGIPRDARGGDHRGVQRHARRDREPVGAREQTRTASRRRRTARRGAEHLGDRAGSPSSSAARASPTETATPRVEQRARRAPGRCGRNRARRCGRGRIAEDAAAESHGSSAARSSQLQSREAQRPRRGSRGSRTG